MYCLFCSFSAATHHQVSNLVKLMTGMAKCVAEGLALKFDNQEDCDVVFDVDGKRIGAHKIVLSIRSEVLDKMASGWMRHENPIPIDTMNYKTFEAMLRYIYSDEILISKANVFLFLSAAICFKIPSLEQLCVDHISQSLGKENCCLFMNEAIDFSSTVLQQKCVDMFSCKTNEVIYDPSFFHLSQPALSALLEAEETNVLEIIIFHLVKEWMKKKCIAENLPVTGTNMRQVLGHVLYKIHFPTMTVQDFGNCVATIDGLLTCEEQNLVFKMITCLDNKNIVCPFPNTNRCQISKFQNPFKDMSHLCNQQVFFGHNKHCNLNSSLVFIRDCLNNQDFSASVVSIRLALQCFADMANSTSSPSFTNARNQQIRNELYNDFRAWIDICKTKDVHSMMTKFTELKVKLNKVCEWF